MKDSAEGYGKVRKRVGRMALKVPEHHAVMEAVLGVELFRGPYQVHHIDGNKLNNRPCNLQVLTRRGHALVHVFNKVAEQCGVKPSNFSKRKRCRMRQRKRYVLTTVKKERPEREYRAMAEQMQASCLKSPGVLPGSATKERPEGE